MHLSSIAIVFLLTSVASAITCKDYKVLPSHVFEPLLTVVLNRV